MNEWYKAGSCRHSSACETPIYISGHCPPICFRSANFAPQSLFCWQTHILWNKEFSHLFLKKTNNFSTKKWHAAWHLSKNKTLQIVLTNGIGVVPYLTLFPLVLQGNRSLEWKYFLVTVKKNDPGVWAVYGASRHVKGWRKMTAVSHQDLTAFTKQLTPFWQMEIYPKERVFVPFLFVFLCFPLQSWGK